MQLCEKLHYKVEEPSTMASASQLDAMMLE